MGPQIEWGSFKCQTLIFWVAKGQNPGQLFEENPDLNLPTLIHPDLTQTWKNRPRA